MHAERSVKFCKLPTFCYLHTVMTYIVSYQHSCGDEIYGSLIKRSASPSE
jgi:hypothetical protein